MRNRSLRRQLCLVLVSAALLAFQIALMQILATSQWHHFAALIIAIALLGFGVAGTLLTLLRRPMLRHQERLLPLLLCGCAATLAASLGLVQGVFGGFDSFLLFVDPGESLRLLATALLLMLPFTLGALAIGLIFTAGVSRIGRLYFANMFGSGLGCLLGLTALNVILPPLLPPLFALLPLVAAIALVARWQRVESLALLTGLVVVFASLSLQPRLQLSQYKDLRRVLDLPGARSLAHVPSAAGQIEVVAAPGLRSAPGLSLNWQGELPSRPAVFVNGNGVGSMIEDFEPGSAGNASTAALPYALIKPREVLVLNAGTGMDVARALAHDATTVLAVEPHRRMTNVLQHLTAPQPNAPYNDPKVSWQAVSPRTWLARNQQRFDLVVLPTLGSFGGSSGLFSLHEQPLFTREALQQTWNSLRPQGVLAVSAWIDQPPRYAPRFLYTLAEVLAGNGVSAPPDHVVAIRNWALVTFCIKKSPWTPAERDRVRTFAAQWGFDPTLMPDLDAAERRSFHRLQDERLLTLLDAAFSSSQRQEIYHDYLFRLRPVSDDRPFFSQFLRWDRIDTLTGLYGQRAIPFLELGLLVAALAAVLLSVLAVILIVLPLFRTTERQFPRIRTLLYFGGLGAGYMWTELALIHRFELYLGQPVYAAALVVGLLLTGSAVGSFLTDRIADPKPSRIAALVAMILVIYALAAAPFLQATLSLSLPARTALAILVLTPAAIVMGMPFPLGLRCLDRRQNEDVPWAWGINGCLSVVGAAFATILAVELGYRAVFLLAAGAYVLAATIRFRVDLS